MGNSWALRLLLLSEKFILEVMRKVIGWSISLSKYHIFTSTLLEIDLLMNSSSPDTWEPPSAVPLVPGSLSFFFDLRECLDMEFRNFRDVDTKVSSILMSISPTFIEK